ncbi:MAG: PD-(D/E)XK nuclease family protein [Alphaproteobacteria bacterium]|nr:PD-(D/E)XK nuclease family protein [Alphaproteobacteria bacterium]
MLNNNVFNVSDPAHTLDALWYILEKYKQDFSDVLIFLPSRRAIRSVERMIIKKIGHAVILPELIPLGTGVEDSDEDNDDDIFSNQERVIILSKLLSADANIKNISTALPIAHDFIRMQDYLENEGIKISDVQWSSLIDEKYAKHFQNKARILDILKQLPNDKLTSVSKRNNDIRSWIKKLDEYKQVIVCGSTASVPATADLMYEIAQRDNGKIILSGKISGREDDFELDTNPYNAEYKFLKRLGLKPTDVQTIDVGTSRYVDILNIAFENTGKHVLSGLDNCHLIECVRESEEACAAVEITKRAIKQNKTVLIITPDAAANQRIKSEMMHNNINADFSAGLSGKMTNLGRAILNLFEYWCDNNQTEFEQKYQEYNYNIFNMLVDLVDNNPCLFQPSFTIENEQDIPIWNVIKSMSEYLNKNGIILNVFDARAFVKDAIDSVSVRPVLEDDCKVCVLGTIESRMQTADVVILTGLNEGMFPTTGYENSWLPRKIAMEIGLPSPNRKVSLMALDFINLSCCREVYWLRSKQSGGVLINESRFLSRVRVAIGDIQESKDILESVRKTDDVPYEPLDYSPPIPPIDRSDVYVTELELLIHNPYAFYAKHILKLKPVDDYWVLPDSRNFGILVHDVIENSTNFDVDELIQEMDTRAKQVLEKNSVLFYFWHKRFCEIAPFVNKHFKSRPIGKKEISGGIKINGRNVRARADIVWNDTVMDIKTGKAPSKKQLTDGTMPQLPLEAYILQSGGFPIKMKDVSIVPIMQFLQLKNGDLDLIEYSGETAQEMIDNTVQKVKELFGQYSGLEPAAYEYRESVGAKYHEYDDLARVND